MLGSLLARTLHKTDGESLKSWRGAPFASLAFFAARTSWTTTRSSCLSGSFRRSWRERRGDVFAVSAEKHEREAVEPLARRIEDLAPGCNRSAPGIR